MQTMKIWTGRDIPRIGVGCWAIGGDVLAGQTHTGYGHVDDAHSLAGLRLADEMGARLFDTAAYYGGGHSERLLGLPEYPMAALPAKKRELIARGHRKPALTRSAITLRSASTSRTMIRCRRGSNITRARSFHGA